ncbi:hypothetical protein B0H10DRAFT_2225752 [Mycena sp. CBHHK59/15]|nr:hypothetical protein B0H10DRAFT_2225752 [Mycena sp. CBHHK59/15]
MTSFPAATTAPSASDQLRAVLATVDKLATQVDKLADCADAIADLASSVQAKLPAILKQLHEEAAEDNIFMRAIPKSPAEVAADHARAADGSRPWWVVFVGREPGIYDTVEEANRQVKGCPNQECRRKGSKQEALNFYELMYGKDRVQKWVELVE